MLIRAYFTYKGTVMDGDVYTIRVTDADSSQLVFTHGESVKYAEMDCDKETKVGSFANALGKRIE